MRLWKSRDNGTDYDEAQRLAWPLRVKDLVYGVNISLRYRYLYCETPKVASSTIKKTLQDLELEGLGAGDASIRRLYDRSRSPLLNPLQVGDFKALLADPRFFKFCFVRNPYARILSAYLDKFEMDPDSRRHALRKYRMRGELWKRNIEFKDFIELVSRQRPEQMDLHWRPQVLQIFKGAIAYDQIGKLENFRADFRSVLEHIGADPTSFEGVRVEATHASKKVLEYYDQRSAETVRSLYKEDFEAFGYTADLAKST
jgi:hypothetical protein